MGNSYVSFYMHYIFSTKQRLPLIVPEIQDRLWPYMVGIARQNNLKALAVGGYAGSYSPCFIIARHHFHIQNDSNHQGEFGEMDQFHIIHKDIKSANILFNPETGDLRLIDFSSASLITRETPTVETSMLMTATLPYMSPEQTVRMNRLVDWRTDFYSLGVTLYELFTGRLPFPATEPLELVHAHMALCWNRPMKSTIGIPPVLSDIILKLMSKDAEDRYQSALGIVHDLNACRDQLSASGRIGSNTKKPAPNS